MEVIQIVVLVMVTGTLLLSWWGLRHADVRGDYVRVVRSIRWWMPLAAVGTILIVIGLLLVLRLVPVLRVGWWSLLGGSGNIMFGQSNSSSVIGRVFAVLIPILFFTLIPLLALIEERAFRGPLLHASRPRVLLGSAKFGLLHLLMGIPIAAGIALTFSGVVLAVVARRVYRLREQAWLSTRERVVVGGAPADAGLAADLPALRELWREDALMTSAALHALINTFLLLTVAVLLLWL